MGSPLTNSTAPTTLLQPESASPHILLKYVECTGSPLIVVASEEDARTLWSLGWYGKGALSRGKPMCCNNNNNNSNGSSNGNTAQKPASAASSGPPPAKAPRESELVLLSHIECFYLAFLSEYRAAIVVDGKTKEECWSAFCAVNFRFPYLVAAYAYFRRKGWAPRTGLSHGVDFLLYRPLDRHTHAEYSVIVADTGTDSATWARLLQTSRNMVSVAKALVVCRVVGSSSSDCSDCGASDWLESAVVNTVVLTRWDPNKSR